MAAALAAVATVAVIVLIVAGLVVILHRVLRPTEMNARSATALRELEPRGGRHRFHVRLFEVIVLASVSITGLGVLFFAAAVPDVDPVYLSVGGGALVLAVWWAWRRGVLRAVESDQQHGEHGVPIEEAARGTQGPQVLTSSSHGTPHG
jgi:hypothetical protein